MRVVPRKETIRPCRGGGFFIIRDIYIEATGRFCPLEEKLRRLNEEANKALAEAHTIDELNEIRVRILGKKGELTQILRGMGSLSAEERPRIGQVANEVRDAIERELASRTASFKELIKEQKLRDEGIDVTLPGTPLLRGRKHPLTIIREEIQEIFLGLGYSIADGPEIETDYYNFEALNLPKDHPARDMQDPPEHRLPFLRSCQQLYPQVTRGIRYFQAASWLHQR